MTALEFTVAAGLEGEYSFPAMLPGSLVVAEISGSFDSGTVTLGYVNTAGTFTSFKDASGNALTATSAAAWEIRLPASGKLALAISDTADDLALISLRATPCK